MTAILIADSDPCTRKVIHECLRRAGFACLEAGDGSEVMDILEQGLVDLVFLDTRLPGMDGLTGAGGLCAANIPVPVILLDADGKACDEPIVPDGGADGRLLKPFGLRELVSCVNTVMDCIRYKTPAGAGRYCFGGLVVDVAGHSVWVDGQEVALAPKTFDLLVFLAEHRGLVLSREKILQEVWKNGCYGDEYTVDTHIQILRGCLGHCRNYIVTIWEAGYMFDPESC